MSTSETIAPALLVELAGYADQADAESAWPMASWEVLGRTGALGWSIATEDGGDGLHGPALLEHYQTLASACLTTMFLLSQRDAACRRLRDHGSPTLRRELLPPLAAGERFATVGLSQLTTSRQHLQAPITARLEAEAVVLDGVIPWVTGAAQAHHIVVGAFVENGDQVLLVLPTDFPGVVVDEPLELMALRGSMTAEVRCQHVHVPRRWLLAGPAPRVLQSGSGGTGGLETSCLALGLAQAAIAHLHQEAGARPPLEPVAARLQRKWQQLRTRLQRQALAADPDAAPLLRGRANALVLQATQAALTASKGTGYVRPHPAQRWARQALFFLVWSCPWPAAAATLEYLTARGPQECS